MVVEPELRARLHLERHDAVGVFYADLHEDPHVERHHGQHEPPHQVHAEQIPRVMPCTSVRECVYGITSGRSSSCVWGKAEAVRTPNGESSACGVSIVTPDASRPAMKMAGPSRRAYADGRARSGCHHRWASGKAKPSGLTPTSVCGAPSPAPRGRSNTWTNPRENAASRMRPFSEADTARIDELTRDVAVSDEDEIPNDLTL